MTDPIDQIRRAHASAKPKIENPAWQNCHHDCGVLLREIERLRDQLSRANYAPQVGEQS